jgi:DNA-binding transcriptional LysR family regulator
MEIKQIRCFLAVYEEGSFSKAASRLNATQPGLSVQIAGLETELGVNLFERHARGVQPTAAGRRFYQHGLDLLRAANSANEEMRSLSGKIIGNVTAGIPPTISRAALAPVLSRYVQTYPDVNIRVVEAYSNNLVSLINGREVDFAVVTFVPGNSALEFTEIFRDRFVLVSGRALGLTPMAPFRMDSRADLKLVLPSLRNGLHRLLDEPLQTGRIKASKIIEIDGLGGALEFVAISDWAALMTAASVRDLADDDRLVISPIEGEQIEVRYFLAHLASAPLSAAGQAFSGLLSEELGRITGGWRESLSKTSGRKGRARSAAKIF